MANYLEMNREELTAEKAKLNEQYKKFLAMNLKLNMARNFLYCSFSFAFSAVSSSRFISR